MAKSKNIGIAIIGVLAGASATPSAADLRHQFSIYNSNHTVAIKRVWFVHDGPWIEVNKAVDIKPHATESFTVYSSDACFFDVKIQFSDDFVQVWQNVDVCRGETLTAK